MSFTLDFLLSPHGRVSRRGLWLGFVLGLAVLLTGAHFADQALTRDHAFTLPPLLEPLQWALDLVGGPVTLAVIVFLPWINTVMVLKRLHDRGFGGLILIWKLVALVALGWLAFNAHFYLPAPTGIIVEGAAAVIALLMVLRLAIIVLFLSGQEGPNRFGPDPLDRT